MRAPHFMSLSLAAVSLLTGAMTALADPPLAQTMPAAQPVGSIQPVACWAVPSNNSHYIGYYVGGGCNCLGHADPRRPDEGTWGWDYRGWLIPRWVNLGWWHGRRYQGGTGAYRTDGPHYHEEESAGGEH
jgi:hypothetical protein